MTTLSNRPTTCIPATAPTPGNARIEAGALRSQAGDAGACEAALEPARAAISVGLHKAPSGNPAHATLPYLRSFTGAWVYTIMMTLGVSLLEKQRKYAEATDLLRQLLGARRPLLSAPPSQARVDSCTRAVRMLH